MAKQIEIEIGGEKYILRRSWNTAINLEKRFGTVDISTLFQREQGRMETLLGVLACLLRTSSGKPVNEQAIGDLIDISDTIGIIEKIGNVMGDGEPKDPRVLAPFVPTPEALIERMLDVAELKAGEIFVDPCCGDGRTLVAAGKRGAEVDGYELNEQRYRSIGSTPTGVPGLRQLVCDDGMNADFRDADVVFLYTLPGSNVKMQPKLLAECKDGCRILSHAFDMPGWPKAHEETFENKRFFMWRISDVRRALDSATAA